MNVLVACERSGVVRQAFRVRGFDAWSCDLEPAEDNSDFHIVGDALETAQGRRWDMMVAHPPCTYLSRAGARWWSDPRRQALADDAFAFVMDLWSAPIHYIAIENPIGQLNQRWRYPDQTIQPHDFGHPFSKATCLWLKNLPPLFATMGVDEYRPLIRSNVTARNKAGKPQTGVLSGGFATARTFTGVAEAMADQWGDFIRMEERGMKEEEYQAGLERLRLEWGSLVPDPEKPGVLRAANDPLTGIFVGLSANLIAEIINRALEART